MKLSARTFSRYLKDNISFCDVVFSTSIEKIWKKGMLFLLEGWRNATARHNFVIIDDIN